jgi:hypothetical protein
VASMVPPPQPIAQPYSGSGAGFDGNTAYNPNYVNVPHFMDIGVLQQQQWDAYNQAKAAYDAAVAGNGSAAAYQSALANYNQVLTSTTAKISAFMMQPATATGLSGWAV